MDQQTLNHMGKRVDEARAIFQKITAIDRRMYELDNLKAHEIAVCWRADTCNWVRFDHDAVQLDGMVLRELIRERMEFQKKSLQEELAAL